MRPARQLASIASIAAACALALLTRPLGATPAEVRKDWPCPGCLAAVPVPSGDAGAPPLLVALHGDFNGDSSANSRVFRALRPAAERAGVTLVALRCPVERGCRSGSFWRWYGTSEHDPQWLDAQIARVAAEVPVDGARVYAAGYSGGATYLGWYGPTHAGRFAAIAHLAGGMPWGTACPRCKVPVLFALGAGDPMLVPYTRPLRDYYQACGGHEVDWTTLPGVSHDGLLAQVQGELGTRVLGWLLAHRAACGPSGEAMDAGGPGDAGARPGALIADASMVDASIADARDADASITDARDADASIADARDAGAPLRPSPMRAMPAPLPRVAPGCACALDRRSAGGEAGIAGALLLILRRRARATRSSRSP